MKPNVITCLTAALCLLCAGCAEYSRTRPERYKIVLDSPHPQCVRSPIRDADLAKMECVAKDVSFESTWIQCCGLPPDLGSEKRAFGQAQSEFSNLYWKYPGQTIWFANVRVSKDGGGFFYPLLGGHNTSVKLDVYREDTSRR